MPKDSNKIIVADDDRVSRTIVTKTLRNANYEVSEYSNGKQVIENCSSETDLVVLDLLMPELDGLQTLTHLTVQYPNTKVVVLTSVTDTRKAVELMGKGAYWYLNKPVNSKELLSIVKRAIETRELTTRNKELLSAVETTPVSKNLIGNSQVHIELWDKVEKVASLNSTLLITGESGTGKTALARAIHEMSPRKKQAFISINCAAIPSDLLEAEFFGYEKGAFTGADTARPGRLEIADGGTVFLDEIGDLPLSLQPKLLSFLQDRTVRRIGSNKEKTIDVRLITATLQNLPRMCYEKQFREDLYFRLNVVSLTVPALRERKSDISLLVRNKLTKLSQSWNKPEYNIRKEAMKLLETYNWPGNIRELEHIIERAAIFCSSQCLEIEDIEPLLKTRKIPSAAENATEILTLSGLPLSEIERQALIATLKFTAGNKSKAARILQISEKGLYNKMKRHGIKKSDIIDSISSGS